MREWRSPRLRRLMALAVPAVLTACASAGGGRAQVQFSREVGAGTASDVSRDVDALVRKYNFQIVSRAAPPYISIETSWKGRMPFADEAAAGVEEARDRVLVHARPRRRGGRELYTVEFTIERLVRLQGADEWVQRPISAEFREYAQRIAEDLEARLRGGIRRF